MISTIKCPKCGSAVEISEAFRHEVEEAAVASEKAKHQEEIEKVRKLTEDAASNRLKSQYDLQEKLIKEELGAAREQNKNLIEQLTAMQKTMMELKRKDEERTIEMQKKLAEDTEKIRQDVQKKAEEAQYLKLQEKDKQLQDALKMNEELSRKLQQGSQQNQGEVMELDLEKMLMHEFPNDKISPVGKGVRGADIIQDVWDRNGNNCGRIVWESKNAKWKDDWIPKLKEDMRQAGGEVAILVAENLPEDIKETDYRDGVWIVKRDRSCIIPMAYTLRFSVVQVHFEKKKNEGKMEKSEMLFNYINGTGFRQRLEAIYESFKSNQEEIERERKWFQTKWARQEKAFRIALDHMYGIVGEIQGIDKNYLGNIKILELPEATPLLESDK